jgi:hypothetical protein
VEARDLGEEVRLDLRSREAFGELLGCGQVDGGSGSVALVPEDVREQELRERGALVERADGIGDDHPGDGVVPTGLMPDVHALPGIWTPIKGYDRLVERIRVVIFPAYRPDICARADSEIGENIRQPPGAIAWLAKVFTLRYGGLKAYRGALPFFLGLILGDFLAGGLWTLIGCLTGVSFAYFMQIWVAYDWPLVVGGKPFASIVPDTIIGFELNILLRHEGRISTRIHRAYKKLERWQEEGRHGKPP